MVNMAGQDAREVDDNEIPWPLSELKTWVEIRAKEIDRIRTMCGSWEAWLQIELALSLAMASPRETHSFRQGTAIFDVVRYPGDPLPKLDIWGLSNDKKLHDHVGLTSRCRTTNETSTDSKKRRVNDIWMMENIRKPGPMLRATQVFAVGLTEDVKDKHEWPTTTGDRGSRPYPIDEILGTKILGPLGKPAYFIVWWQRRYGDQ